MRGSKMNTVLIASLLGLAGGLTAGTGIPMPRLPGPRKKNERPVELAIERIDAAKDKRAKKAEKRARMAALNQQKGEGNG